MSTSCICCHLFRSVAISAQDGSAQARSALLPQGDMATIIGPAKIGKDKADATWRWLDVGSVEDFPENGGGAVKVSKTELAVYQSSVIAELLPARSCRCSPGASSAWPGTCRRWPARSTRTRTAWRRPGKGIMQQPR